MFPFKKPYFIGIKGAGMVGLATLLDNAGVEVKGSDVEERFFSDEILDSLDIAVESFESSLPEDIDGIVYSAAYDEKHPQRVEAHKRRIKQLSYFEAVGKFAEKKSSIAVIGTHGKTTTTALAACLFDAVKLDPNVLVGSSMPQFGDKTARASDSEYFLIEACEYKNHFRHIPAEYVLCTNIDYDHVDYFKTPEDYRQTFLDYLSSVNTTKVVSHVSCKLGFGVTYGEKSTGADVHYTFIGMKDGCQVVRIFLFGQSEIYHIPLFGIHMVENFVGALAMLYLIAFKEGIKRKPFFHQTMSAIKNFKGVKRRMESYSFYNQAFLFDDYAHHPLEIEKTIEGIKTAFPDKKIHVVFQSHTYSRTQELLDEFIESFAGADAIYIAPIYASAREEKIEGLNELFMEKMKKYKNCTYGSFEEITIQLKNTLGEKDIVCTMGAGDIWKVVEELKNAK